MARFAALPSMVLSPLSLESLPPTRRSAITHMLCDPDLELHELARGREGPGRYRAARGRRADLPGGGTLLARAGRYCAMIAISVDRKVRRTGRKRPCPWLERRSISRTAASRPSCRSTVKFMAAAAFLRKKYLL